MVFIRLWNLWSHIDLKSTAKGNYILELIWGLLMNVLVQCLLCSKYLISALDSCFDMLFNSLLLNIYAWGKFWYSDQISKKFPSWYRYVTFQWPSRVALTSRLSWLNDSFETLSKRLTWQWKRCNTSMLKVKCALFKDGEIFRITKSFHIPLRQANWCC